MENGGRDSLPLVNSPSVLYHHSIRKISLLGVRLEKMRFDVVDLMGKN